jgi:hypothetical protein
MVVQQSDTSRHVGMSRQASADWTSRSAKPHVGIALQQTAVPPMPLPPAPALPPDAPPEPPDVPPEPPDVPPLPPVMALPAFPPDPPVAPEPPDVPPLPPVELPPVAPPRPAVARPPLPSSRSSERPAQDSGTATASSVKTQRRTEYELSGVSRLAARKSGHHRVRQGKFGERMARPERSRLVRPEPPRARVEPCEELSRRKLWRACAGHARSLASPGLHEKVEGRRPQGQAGNHPH